jgi:cytochrome P450
LEPIGTEISDTVNSDFRRACGYGSITPASLAGHVGSNHSLSRRAAINSRHFTFVAGVHLCLGAPLARRELRIPLDEWSKRIPDFRVKPGTDTAVSPGLLSIRNLPLVWDS